MAREENKATTAASGPEAEVKVKGAPRGESRNEALVVDRNDWIVRIYAREDDGKGGRKYPQRVHQSTNGKYRTPLNARKLVRLSKSEVVYEPVAWDGVVFPAYTVCGDSFIEKAQGFINKFNEREDVKAMKSDGRMMSKNHGYKKPYPADIRFGVQDLADYTVQFGITPSRPFKLV